VNDSASGSSQRVRAGRDAEVELPATGVAEVSHIQPKAGPTGDRKVDSTPEQDVALVVDLDGTLTSTDLLLESLFVLTKNKPLRLLQVPFWLLQGLAPLKRHLAKEAAPDARTLPYDQEFLSYLESQKRAGRLLVLATGTDRELALRVAEHIGLFDGVFASDGITNLTGSKKRDRLVAEFGIGGFDYAGNSHRDRDVWASARKAILVRPPARLLKAEEKKSEVSRVFERKALAADVYGGALRVAHWTKNALVFLPLIAAHRLYDAVALGQAFIAFLSFSLCASSIYLLNDLVDLSEDRGHPIKRQRMLASGRLSVRQAIGLMLCLLFGAFALSFTLPADFRTILGAYYLLMVAYCLRLRDLAILDIATLALGYTLRMLAGATATGLAASAWLLIFCILFFAGLALLKRYAELVAVQRIKGPEARVHAYLVRDSGRLVYFGFSSSCLAVAALAFHFGLNDRLHGRRDALWVVFVLLLYWVTHMWGMARRGQISGDPVAFALTDCTSRIVGILIAIALLVST
jgi:4-hydroxybenzoate polyprenyltransferase/phosphoserine phosphatase